MVKYIILLLGLASVVVSVSQNNDQNYNAKRLRLSESIWSLNKSASSKSLEFLGKVGNKRYFADNIFNMTWQEAKLHCTEMGMTLATVETYEENIFLTRAYQVGVFDKGYWTGARDAHVLRQLSWDGPNTAVDVDMDFVVGEWVKPSLTCGILEPARLRAPLRMQPCANRYADVGVLCELTT